MTPAQVVAPSPYVVVQNEWTDLVTAVFGPFDTAQEAKAFGDNLNGTTQVLPLTQPAEVSPS